MTNKEYNITKSKEVLELIRKILDEHNEKVREVLDNDYDTPEYKTFMEEDFDIKAEKVLDEIRKKLDEDEDEDENHEEERAIKVRWHYDENSPDNYLDKDFPVRFRFDIDNHYQFNVSDVRMNNRVLSPTEADSIGKWSKIGGEMVKTCKECPNYEGIGENLKGKVYIKCAVLDRVSQIRKMDECYFVKWKICSRCGKPTSDIYFCHGKPYCRGCYEDI